MNRLLIATLMRAVRSAVAVWIASQVANNVWYAPIILAASKALRDKFPGKLEWLPV